MNPELLRNSWIELTERRITLMLVIVGSILVVGIAPGSLSGAVSSAELIFYAIVVIWGTRCAAQSVVEEISGKTWDAQRLSAIRPWTMVWGKLIGSTMLAWLGGLLCLGVILYAAADRKGVEGVITEGVYFLTIGFLSQAVALLVSIVAVRRRLTHSRFDVFLYQLFGLAAAIAVWRVWQSANPESLYRRWTGTIDPFTLGQIEWWGGSFDTGTFYIVSLVVFFAWTLLANYRVMRTELQVQNGPAVWFAFLAFVAIYVGGFDFWRDAVRDGGAALGLRAVQAGIALAIVTYVMALVEPKEVVAYRWLIDRLKHGRLLAFLSRTPAWLYAYFATFAAGLVAILALPFDAIGPGAGRYDMGVIVVSALGFLLRDCAIFMALGLGQTGKRSDIAALAVLAVAYVFFPGMFATSPNVTLIFYPSLHDPVWLNPLIAWGQAILAWTLILMRHDLRVRPPT